MYTLYSRPGSGGFVAEAAFALAGVPCRLVDVARADQRDPAFMRVSPLGQLPALTLPDGSSMTESAAISVLVADSNPASNLSPTVNSAARPAFLRWMMFMTSVIYPTVLRVFYTERFTTDPAGIAGVRQSAEAEVDHAFAIVEAGLEGRQWLAGDSFTIADVYLLMLAHWHPVDDRPRAEWTRIVALCERLKTNPTLAELNVRHRLW